MKTVITEQMDGYTVVMGFGDLLTDAVATRAKHDDAIKNDPSTLYAAKIIGKMSETHSEWRKSRRKRRLAAKTQTLEEQFNNMALQVQELRKQIDKKRWDLFQSDPVYFTPKLGEYAINDDDKLISKFPPPKKTVLLADGSVVPDNRNTEYWVKDGKWIRRTIERIGELIPAGAEFSDNLPIEIQAEIREQFDLERIATLDDDKRQSEKEQQCQVALGRSAALRSEKEILGDSDALEQAQKWYATELTRIEQRYS